MKIDYHHRIGILVLVFLSLIVSCKDGGNKSVPPPEIQVIKVIQKDVPLYRDFVGQVYGFQDIPIRARVEGFLIGLHFDEGFPVKKGQLLYTIDSQPFEQEVASMQSRVTEAQTYLTNADNELKRYEPLAEINAVSKSDLDAAIATKEAAEASLEASKANLEMAKINLSYTKIYSPINGLIGKTEAREGEFVGRDPNPVILNVVSDISKARVQFFLTEADYLLLAREMDESGRSVEGNLDRNEPRNRENLDLILADGSVYEEKGTAEFLGRNIDAATGSILVQAIFPNPKRILRPGMYAKVRVEIKVEKDAILVPQRCVTELQGQYSVFVVNQEGIVLARPVTATEKFGDLWLITNGLEANDQIVFEGLQKVKSEMKINPVLTEFQSQIKE